MNYLIINGSPHKGNTWKIVELVKYELQALCDTAVFDEIHLTDLNLPFCSGCSLCFRKGHIYCPHNAIMTKLINAIDNADGVIFVTTTFFFSETALVKNVIDHMCSFTHRPQFFRKRAIIITTTAGAGAKTAAKRVAGFLGAIGFNRTYLLTTSTMSWNDYKPNEKIKKKCALLALKFNKDTLTNKLRSPHWGLLIPYNLFRGMMPAYAVGTQFESLDGVYWTEPQRANNVYDNNIPLPFYKKIFGTVFYIIGKLAGKFVTITYRK